MAQTSLARWSIPLEQQLNDTFYYDPAWLDLISSLYRYSLIPLSTTDKEGQIISFLPLCFMQSPLTGKRLVSLPFSDYCPLPALDESGANALIDQAIDLTQQQKARYLELRTGRNDILERRSDLIAVEDLYVRWLLPLAADPDTMWSQLRKPVQHQIKKSKKLGVQVRIAHKREDMLQYYALHLRTRSKKHGMPAQPQRFFLGLWDRFATRNAVKLLLAEYEGHIIASIILFAAGKTIQYAYGASDERYLQLAPNNLLMWNAISWGVEHGYQTLDMGRTACDNEGLMEFKRRWGAAKEPLTYYYYPQQAGLASTSESNWKYRLLTGCWKKLPLQIVGPLGGSLYKHLG